MYCITLCKYFEKTLESWTDVYETRSPQARLIFYTSFSNALLNMSLKPYEEKFSYLLKICKYV